MPENIPLRDSGQLARSLSAALDLAPSLEYRRRHASALALSGAAGFLDFSPLRNAHSTQGMLQSLYELQQFSCALTGMAAASLALLSTEQSDYAALSMIAKYHQRQRQPRNGLLLSPTATHLTRLAQSMGFEVQYFDSANPPQSTDETLAALVLTTDALQDEVWPTDFIAPLQQQGALVYLCGGDRYPASAIDGGAVDLLSLDLAQLCEVDTPCLALLASESLQDYLPLPYVSREDDVFNWQGVQQKPLSIGTLSQSAGPVSALLQCLVHVRLQGAQALLQRARQAIDHAKTFNELMMREGFYEAPAGDIATGGYRFRLDNSSSAIPQLKKLLDDARKRGVAIESAETGTGDQFELRLSRLHYLSALQLEQLAQQSVAVLKHFIKK